MKNLLAIALSLSVILAFGYWFIKKPLLFLSLESKTSDNGDVYNRIEFIPGFDRDIWVMHQSHLGLKADSWDRLEIVIDKSKSPKEAKFYQYKEEDGFKRLEPFRVPCYSCHSNGPRAIRPKNSNLIEKIQASLLNLRIKTYFRVKSIAGHTFKHAPFKREHQILKEPLPLESCGICHSDGGIRNPLTLEHETTARFLIENKEMPPWPFSLSDKDKKELEKWGL